MPQKVAEVKFVSRELTHDCSPASQNSTAAQVKTVAVDTGSNLKALTVV